MRKIQKSKLADLKKLTNLKKVMLEAELALVSAELQKLESKIEELKRPISDECVGMNARATANWQLWRRQELLRLNATKALIRNEHSQAQSALGKASAEDSTVDHLQKALEVGEKTRLRRLAEFSSSSHFLSNDVCD